ncbi:hypothetical protein [Halomonas aquatica]|uniref:hypothetical protein n=1 Tax=Halomonas aquatica TaxID=3151123 RepID=UPI003D80FE49
MASSTVMCTLVIGRRDGLIHFAGHLDLLRIEGGEFHLDLRLGDEGVEALRDLFTHLRDGASDHLYAPDEGIKDGAVLMDGITGLLGTSLAARRDCQLRVVIDNDAQYIPLADAIVIAFDLVTLLFAQFTESLDVQRRALGVDQPQGDGLDIN